MTSLPPLSPEMADLLESLCLEELSPADAARLEDLVCSDVQCCRQYIVFMEMHALAERFGAEGRGAGDQRRGMAGSPAIDGEEGFGVRGSGFGVRESEPLSAGAAVELPHQLEPRAPNPEPPFPTLSTTHYPPSTDPFVGSWAFSCMVATVIMGVMLLVFWAMKVTHQQHIAEAPSQSAPSDARPEMVFVGRITGMLDVQWSDDPHYLPPPDFAHVPLDRKYILSSGLMEITYDSGAKVILQGPCTYEVESENGGYLALGKLTAKVEKERSEVRSQRSDPSPLSPLPSPLFSVRTPTAVVTDLGTEFGVEVSEEGATEVHVLQGEVVSRPRSAEDGGDKSVRVKAGHAVRIGPDRGEFAPVDFAATGFVRQLQAPSEPDADADYIRVVLADKPLAYWPLNEPARSRRFADRSGNGFHGWAMGGVLAGQPGPLSSESLSAAMDGKGYIDVGRQEQFAFADDFTVEAWIWLDVGATDIERIISADAIERDTTVAGWSLQYVPENAPPASAGRPCLQFTLYNVRDLAFDGVAVPTQQWVHVAVVYHAGKAVHLFLNGRRQASLVENLMPKARPVWVAIGSTACDFDCPYHPYCGRLAHVAVYPYALSEERIERHYRQVNAPEERASGNQESTPQNRKEGAAMNGP